MQRFYTFGCYGMHALRLGRHHNEVSSVKHLTSLFASTTLRVMVRRIYYRKDVRDDPVLNNATIGNTGHNE
jgi:hypothetical protein